MKFQKKQLAFFLRVCYNYILSGLILIRIACLDGFPSGQRGQTVNLLQIASVVRIHLHPFVITQVITKTEKILSYRVWLSRRGGTGRRTGLKILRDLYSRTGSIPVAGIATNHRCGWLLSISNLYILYLWVQLSWIERLATDQKAGGSNPLTHIM